MRSVIRVLMLLNRTLLRALSARTSRERRKRFLVEPHSCRLKPGIDLDKLNQFVDEAEAEAWRKSLPG